MPNNLEQVMGEVTGIFRDVLNNDSIQMKYETSAADVPEWDSLNHIEIITAIERHFGIRFNFSELQKFQNVGQMCENIVSKLQTS